MPLMSTEKSAIPSPSDISRDQGAPIGGFIPQFSSLLAELRLADERELLIPGAQAVGVDSRQVDQVSLLSREITDQESRPDASR